MGFDDTKAFTRLQALRARLSRRFVKCRRSCRLLLGSYPQLQSRLRQHRQTLRLRKQEVARPTLPCRSPLKVVRHGSLGLWLHAVRPHSQPVGYV